VLDALSQRYSSYQLEDARRTTYLLAAYQSARCGTPTLASLQEFEPHVPWNAQGLEIRSACYSQAGFSLAEQARKDYEDFVRGERR
jgi:hypothetical protein